MCKKTSIISILLLFAFLAQAQEYRFKKGFIQQQVSNELVSPTCLAIAPDGRIFITEKGGNLRVMQDGELIGTPFLTLQVDEHGERGLGSVALDPDFEKNGYIYVYYSVYNKNFNRLSRFTANGNLAIPNSEKILMNFDKLDGTIHNSGAMRFGKDGTLFITTGDGVSSANSQDPESLLGKMIRINPDGSIPKDNPFYDEHKGVHRSIYAFGFRNSFTFDLNPKTGQILANDVGHDKWEEVNDVRAGKNYGWPTVEGKRSNQEVPDNYEDPLFTYPHGKTIGCAIVGGAFYQPETPTFPEEYEGKYFFSDYCLGVVSVLNPSNGDVVDTIMWGASLLSNMVVSSTGDLYYLSFLEGELWRIIYVGDGSPFISKQPEDLLRVVGEDAFFELDAYGDDLVYQWYANGLKLDNQTTDTLFLPSVKIEDDNTKIYCEISNKLGIQNTKTVTLSVTTNQRPIPQILSPTEGYKFVMGEKLPFSGKATDPEDGNLGKNQLEWKIDFHHDLHNHPSVPATSGMTSGVMEIPTIGETDTNVWFRVHLKATDSEGLSNSVYVDAYPIIHEFSVKTIPKKLQIGLDGTLLRAPYIQHGAEGNDRVLTAPEEQVKNDSMFKFAKWSSGSTENNRWISVSKDKEYTAVYEYKKRFYQGRGNGLTGKYFANTEFEEPTVFERIDPKIDFYWNWFSVIETGRTDSCSVHWSGSILAPITGLYTFTMEYDDAAKLDIGEVELMEDLEHQHEGEQSNTMYLFGGEQYNIDLWYVEKRWSCKMKLMWSYEEQEKQIIPQDYLYTERVSDSIEDPRKNLSQLFVYPNPAQDETTILFRSFKESLVRIEIYNTQGQLVKSIGSEKNINWYQLDLQDFQQGAYIIRAMSDQNSYLAWFSKTGSPK